MYRKRGGTLLLMMLLRVVVFRRDDPDDDDGEGLLLTSKTDANPKKIVGIAKKSRKRDVDDIRKRPRGRLGLIGAVISWDSQVKALCSTGRTRK